MVSDAYPPGSRSVHRPVAPGPDARGHVRQSEPPVIRRLLSPHRRRLPSLPYPRHVGGSSMRRPAASALYVIAMVAVVVGVDVLFFRHRFGQTAGREHRHRAGVRGVLLHIPETLVSAAAITRDRVWTPAARRSLPTPWRGPIRPPSAPARDLTLPHFATRTPGRWLRVRGAAAGSSRRRGNARPGPDAAPRSPAGSCSAAPQTRSA